MGLRSIQYLEPGSAKKVFFDHPAMGASVSFIATDEDPGQAAAPSLAAWRLRFYVQGGDEGEQSGYAYVGSVRTLPWSPGSSRVVALCSVPGARQWAVDGRPEDRSFTGRLRLDCIASPHLGSLGVHPVDGVSLAGARSLRVISGAAGLVNVPGAVLGWTATSDPLIPGSVSVQMPGWTAPTIIALQPGQTLSDHYGEASGDSVSFTFINTVSYVVDYELTGNGVDAF